MKKYYLIIFVVLGVSALIAVLFYPRQIKEPIEIVHSGSIEYITVDEKIEEAELIFIGEVKAILPSQWTSPSGKEIKNATVNEIFESGGLFTDTLISVVSILKGSADQPIVRIRSFAGETEQVRWVDSLQVSYEKGQSYLLFVRQDTGPTAHVEPGYYTSVNASTAIYKIIGDKAISSDDEWLLDDLIAYIENTLASESILPTEPPALPSLPTETPIPTETPTSAPAP
jgi:hypothetical protein